MDENNSHILFFLGFWPSGQPLLAGRLLGPLESLHVSRRDQSCSVSPAAWSMSLADWNTQIAQTVFGKA